MEWARHVTLTQAQDLNQYLPDRWAASVVVNAAGERFEETLVQSPFDGDAPDVKAALTKKWRRIVSAKGADDLLTDAAQRSGYAILWQRLKRRLNCIAAP